MLRRLALVCAVAISATWATASPAGAVTGRLQRILTGLDQPLYLTAPPGDTHRLFIVEKGGRIVIDDSGHLRSTAFLNISKLVSTGGEQGLLGLAFDPAYATTGRFFISYTNRDGNSRIAQYRVLPNHPNLANPYSRRILVAFHQPYSNHNGGDIAFGPGGNLFMGFGDGGSEGDPHLYGQRRTGFLSKILRMHVNVPHPHPSMYAYGLRNPGRFSFDSVTGGLWIGDVGQNSWEEIDHIGRRTAAGVNLGWSYYEGDHVFKRQPINRRRLAFPVAEYPHNASPANCAVTGGYVYHGRDVPTLDGYYIFADFCSGRMWRLRPPHGRPVEMSASRQVTQISSFGEGNAGGLYVISLSGSIYKLVAGTPSGATGSHSAQVADRGFHCLKHPPFG
jgi:glucose/arabinose dehydrogenase